MEQYSIREVTKKDLKAIFDLSNTPSVRSVSFRSAPISWKEHVQWFATVLASPDCVFLVADIAGQIAGQIRLNRDEARAMISISVDPRFQGLGIGYSLYHAALAHFQQKWPIVEVVAKIRKNNAASVAFFKKLGFLPAPEESICGEHALVMVSKLTDQETADEAPR